MNSLTTNYRLFLVEFHGVIEQFIFSGQEPGILGDLIQKHGKHGVLTIRSFSTVKSKFEKMNKTEIESYFNWDTHSIEQLKFKNFIK